MRKRKRHGGRRANRGTPCPCGQRQNFMLVWRLNGKRLILRHVPMSIEEEERLCS